MRNYARLVPKLIFHAANRLALNVAKTKYIMFRKIYKRIEYPGVKLNNI